MFDFSWSEIALIVIVALVFIGPKDLPIALRSLSKGIKTIRKMASEFQGHVDDMVREADLGEAREHFRDLKRLNLRDRVAKAVDGDHAIRDSFEMTPRPPSLSAPPMSPAETPNAVAAPPNDIPDLTGPRILPPAAGRRLARERARWYPPHIVPPPMVGHGRRRVALGVTSEAPSVEMPTAEADTAEQEIHAGKQYAGR